MLEFILVVLAFIIAEEFRMKGIGFKEWLDSVEE